MGPRLSTNTSIIDVATEIVNNVTNEKYASMILTNASGVGNAQPRFYYPGLPINFYGIISLNYVF